MLRLLTLSSIVRRSPAFLTIKPSASVGRAVGSMSSLVSDAKTDSPTTRVLSIQSHTVHGYVGNKCATFPLQLLGFEVDPLNTVHFATHAGYGNIRGESTTAAQFNTLLEGLRINGVLNYNYVLSGYSRSQALLESIGELVKELRAKSPTRVDYYLDPVLGDDGKFYVPLELVSVYRDTLLPLATVITPNQFEAEVLSGVTIKTEEDAQEACRVLHAKGPRTVVITSTNVPRDNSAGDDQKQPSNSFQMIASTMPEGVTDPAEALMYRLVLPKMAGRFVGCGDLFASCLLGHTHLHPNDLPTAIELAASAVHDVIALTAKDRPGGELCLVQSRHQLANPKVQFPAEALPSPSQPIAGVIFDMDGTLTLPGHIDFNAMYARIGLPRGEDILEQIRQMPQDKQAAAVKIVEEEEMAALEKLELQPGLHDLFVELRARRIRCAIATRNIIAAVDFFFDRTGLGHDIFAPVLTRDHPYNKPDARVASDVASLWGLPTSAVLFVGDHRDDMACGRGAGCRTCLVQGLENASYVAEHAELIDHYVTHLNQIPALLNHIETEQLAAA